MANPLPHRWLVCRQGYCGQRDRPSVFVIDSERLPEEVKALLVKHRGKSWENVEREWCKGIEDEEERDKKEGKLDAAVNAASTKETQGYVVDDTFVFSASR